MSIEPYILLLLVIAGAALAARTPLPEAVVWSAIGLAVAFIPGVPVLRFDPQLALLFFLPPLVYAAAVDLPWPEFRDNLRPIGLLAVGLVLVTAAAAAAAAHFAAGLPWAAAIISGAVVSPTDPAAASAVAQRVGLPRRLTAILEGEGLVNDAVALVLFRISLAAAVSGTFSPGLAVGRFFAIVIGESLYGWLLGIAIAKLRQHIADPRLEIAISLLTPFAAYLVPESLGGSGILATVAAGMYIGERRSQIVPAGTRLHATSVWQMLVFVLNGFLFLIAGIELGHLLAAARLRVLAEWGGTVAAAVIAVRLAWCGLSWLLLRLLRKWSGRELHPTPFRHMIVLGWSGIRGPVSLAAALSIPAFAKLDDYDAIVLVTAAVIVCTLFLEGLTLPALVRALKLRPDVDREREQIDAEEHLGRDESRQAALEKLEELVAEGRVDDATASRVRVYYQRVRIDPAEVSGDLLRVLIDTERAKILALRNAGRISDPAVARLERRLDLRQSLLE